MEIKVNVPEGYEIDKENSSFDCIKFKPIKSKFSDYDGNFRIEGWGIADDKTIYRKSAPNTRFGKDVFATEKQAKSALAMAQISQIMANDERFGGPVADEEWESDADKYCIVSFRNSINKTIYWSERHFLAFHTREQLLLFFAENEQLVKDYLMID